MIFKLKKLLKLALKQEYNLSECSEALENNVYFANI